jgi:hypothetical protein
VLYESDLAAILARVGLADNDAFELIASLRAELEERDAVELDATPPEPPTQPPLTAEDWAETRGQVGEEEKTRG